MARKNKARYMAAIGLTSILIGACGSGFGGGSQPAYEEEEIAYNSRAIGEACRSNKHCISDRCHLKKCVVRTESSADLTDEEEVGASVPQIHVPQIDVRKTWYGTYEGTYFDWTQWWITSTSITRKSEEHEDGRIILEILRGPFRAYEDSSPWYLTVNWNPGRPLPHLYLPEDLNDAPGLTITNTKITITPTEEHPYEVVIEKVPGQFGEVTLQGYIIIGNQCRERDGNCYGDTIEYFAVVGVPEVSVPLGVDQAHVDEVGWIYTQVASGEISESEAQMELDEIAGEIGKDALSWIVRGMPVYSAEDGRWQSFDNYARDFADEAGVDPDTRLAQDPVGVGVDLMFGSPSTDEIMDWLGFGD